MLAAIRSVPQHCAPTDITLWRPPSPAVDLLVSVNSLATGLFWTEPSDPGGHLVRYDVLRSTEPNDFSNAACLVSGTVATAAFESEDPETSFYYLIRSTNACGGNLGTESGGAARIGASCP